jgi:hypothetical protein
MSSGDGFEEIYEKMRRCLDHVDSRISSPLDPVGLWQ